MTSYAIIKNKIAIISTHTLTWSVTVTVYINECSELNFNSHAHVERDIDHDTPADSQFISTHTLTWSVTSSFVIRVTSVSFQLTRSRGA